MAVSSRARPSIFALALALALFGLAPHASAHPAPRLGVDLAFGISGSTDLRTVLLTNALFSLSAPTSPDGGLGVLWGFTIASGDPARPDVAPTYVAIANPQLSWAIRLAEGLVLAPALTLPIARAPAADRRSAAATFAHEGAMGLRGGRDAWLWAPDQFALVLPVTWVQWWDPLLLEAQFKLAYVTPTSSADSDSDFVLEGALRAALNPVSDLWLALTGSVAYTPTDTGDNFQFALYPEVRFVVTPGAHVALGLMFNIDAPLGPFSTPGRYWAIHINGSSRF